MFNPESENKLFTGKFFGALKDLWEWLKERWGNTTTVSITGISINDVGDNTVVAGSSIDLQISIEPPHATEDRTVNWSVDPGSVSASINSNGTLSVGNTTGKVYVTAKLASNQSISATKTFTVTAKPVSVTGVSVLLPPYDDTLNTKNPLIIFAGQKNKPVTVAIKPSDATNPGYTWINNLPNNSIATRSGTTFTGVKEGITSATVNTNDGNIKASFDIVVYTNRYPYMISAQLTMPCNFYAGPGPAYDLRASLPTNTPVNIYGTFGSWFYVWINLNGDSYDGFVPKNSVDLFCSQSQERTWNSIAAVLSSVKREACSPSDIDWASKSPQARGEAVEELFHYVQNNILMTNVAGIEIGLLTGELAQAWGFYTSIDNKIYINSYYLSNYDILKVVLHELRHAYQAEKWRDPSKHTNVSYTTYDYWDPNSSLNTQGDPTSNNPADRLLYWDRPIEWDARQFAVMDHFGSDTIYSGNWY